MNPPVLTRLCARLAASWAVLVLAGLSRAHAVLPFTPENTLLVSSATPATPQAVIPSAGKFQLFFIRGGFEVRSATSTDQRTWLEQSGVRLSTGSLVSDLDVSSITSLGIMLSTAAGSPMRMFYVGVSSAGHYHVLSATSTDGLAWSKETGYRLRVNGGRGFLSSPRPFPASASVTRMFYVADSAGGNTPSAYRLFSASSTDYGQNLTVEGQVLADTAFDVSVTTLTDGRTRLYFTSGSGSTATVVDSAISSNGTSFTTESGSRLSTAAATASLSAPVVFRGTETYRWRMIHGYTPVGSSIPYVSSALTIQPVVVSATPVNALKSQSSVSAAAVGEVFSPAPTAAYVIAGDTIAWTGLTRSDDQNIAGTINPLGKTKGAYSLIVTNANGSQGALGVALTIDVAPGSVTVLDNMFRPSQGTKAAITVTILEAGRIRVDLYTVSGAHVANLLDAEAAAGDTVTTWDGRTGSGASVASGVYLLRVRGPKLDTTEKIVVIK